MRFIHVYIYSIYINNANWVLNSAATKGRKAASSWPTTRCHIHTHRRSYIICTYTYTHHTQLHCSGLCENNKQSAAQKGISTSIHTHRHTHTPRSICASVCALHWRARSHCTLVSSWESKTQTKSPQWVTWLSSSAAPGALSTPTLLLLLLVSWLCMYFILCFFLVLFLGTAFKLKVRIASFLLYASSHATVYARLCVCVYARTYVPMYAPARVCMYLCDAVVLLLLLLLLLLA